MTQEKRIFSTFSLSRLFGPLSRNPNPHLQLPSFIPSYSTNLSSLHHLVPLNPSSSSLALPKIKYKCQSKLQLIPYLAWRIRWEWVKTIASLGSLPFSLSMSAPLSLSQCLVVCFFFFSCAWDWFGAYVEEGEDEDILCYFFIWLSFHLGH